ncbi:hypothetical protein Y032_0105g3693 [Ancylostoma ceylanicum]|uniref:Glycoside hydrolase family 19 catalytic domain-containing protein n=1 Tax=Ancylostoma ceylanicum TaxID=53326 RepID=A0A016TGA9_9BILA|nr:hypothetical protein Y032_0105g3693 [Ancylostoma ceylanicum]
MYLFQYQECFIDGYTGRYAATLDFCPPHSVFIKTPDDECQPATDPNNLKESPIEEWFTREMFEDLFPKANLGLGPHKCLPYSYESFVIAARYFPEFGGETLNKDYNASQHQRRDIAAFFAHTLQETGENDIALYNSSLSNDEATECFYRGGFYHWFERGPNSSFLLPAFPGFQVVDGKRCTEEGQYCEKDAVLNFWYPCNGDVETHANTTYKKGCYFGRGALQVMTKMDPPLAMLASLWFYMTPQPPKPSMHNIVIGDWRQSAKNRRAGFSGPIFGPTSLVINNECGGEDAEEPGMLDNFDAVQHNYSWQPDWGNMWKSAACDCEPAQYGGPLPYYDPKIYPSRFAKENDRNRLRCVYSIYKNPGMFRLDEGNAPCLKHKPRIALTKTGFRSGNL